MASEQGIFLIKSLLQNRENSETLVRMVAIDSKTQNCYSDIYFHLTFIRNLLDSTENYEDSAIYPLESQPVDDLKFHLEPNDKLRKKNWVLVDTIILEVLSIYNTVDHTTYRRSRKFY